MNKYHFIFLWSSVICQAQGTNLQLKLDEKKGKFGFVNQKGEYVIEPQYRCATEFIDGMALVSKKKRCKHLTDYYTGIWHFINENNQMTFTPREGNRSKWYEVLEMARSKHLKEE